MVQVKNPIMLLEHPIMAKECPLKVMQMRLEGPTQIPSVELGRDPHS